MSELINAEQYSDTSKRLHQELNPLKLKSGVILLGDNTRRHVAHAAQDLLVRMNIRVTLPTRQ